MIRTTITLRKDSSNLRKIRRRLNNIHREKVEWGFFSDAVYTEGERAGMPVAHIAWVHNYGVQVPERPFFDAQIKNLQKRSPKRELRTLFQNVIEGKSYKADLEKLGKKFQRILKRTISQWDNPPNADWWAEAKGGDNPLVWTGHMRRSVDYRVK